MATLRSRTVKSSGGDYSSLSAWEAGEQANIVVADEIRRAVCDPFTDTTAVVVDGWTTDATRYAEVIPASGAEAGMPWRTSGAYILAVGGASQALHIYSTYFRLGRIQVDQTGTGPGVRMEATAANQIFADGTYARTASSSSPWQLEGGAICRNCVGKNGFAVFRLHTGGGYCDNCTAIAGSSVGFYTTATSSGTCRVRNCLGYDSPTGDFYSDGVALTGSNNASKDATAPGSGSVTSIADPFVNYASGDYHLAAATSPVNAGTSLSGDFSTDFDGVTRSGTWDIGADEYVAAGGGGGRVHRASPLDGLGGVGQKRFNPSLSYHRSPISLQAYRRERAREMRAFMEKVRRAA